MRFVCVLPPKLHGSVAWVKQKLLRLTSNFLRLAAKLPGLKENLLRLTENLLRSTAKLPVLRDMLTGLTSNFYYN